jgi:hypothetical protein
MRDTSLLRHRLHTALACLPLAAAGLAVLGCGPAAQAPTGRRQGRASSREGRPPADTKPRADPRARRGQPAGRRRILPYPARTGMDPYDPDGIEEEGCPNGDWCGPPKLAEKLQRPQAPEVELGCPTRLMGSAKPGQGRRARSRACP